MNRVLSAAHGGRSALTSGELLHELVLRRAGANPDAVAVRAGGGTLTYGELAARARGVARALVAAGARPDDFVAVAADRSVGPVVGMLGTVLSGAAYVPIDPEAPADRMRLVCADARSARPPGGPFL